MHWLIDISTVPWGRLGSAPSPIIDDSPAQATMPHRWHKGIGRICWCAIQLGQVGHAAVCLGSILAQTQAEVVQQPCASLP